MVRAHPTVPAVWIIRIPPLIGCPKGATAKLSLLLSGLQQRYISQVAADPIQRRPVVIRFHRRGHALLAGRGNIGEAPLSPRENFWLA